MKINNTYILVLIAFFAISFGQDLKAQSDRNVAGKWESVFRKGKQNCELDYIFHFIEDSKATVTMGSRFSECKSYTIDASSWEVTKKEGELNGKSKKWDIIRLSSPEGSKIIAIEEFEGDYMKIQMEVIDGDTTTFRSFILKKIE